LPSDLGFYDLRVDDVHAKQVEMARLHGIRGFCYYYYWFAGRTLLTLPIDRHVEKDYDLDFCLCWANENWSRRWDGSEHEVLMAQEHTEAEDVDFIHSVIPYFKDGRYIRIRGAPLLVVYRISLLSNPLRVIKQWRAEARKAGFPDLHVCMAETFGLNNPHEYGADSSCQFPPHGVIAAERTREVEDIAAGFTGKVYDYREVVANELRRPEPSHLRFRGAMPSWDNTSRRGKAANVFRNHSPELFEAWLSVLFADARRRLPAGERFVFINAWNEWGEGAILEPDRTHGRAFLNAIRNALSLTNGVVGDTLLPPEPDSEAFRRRALATMATLVNANQQLLRCIREHEHPTAGASPFIAPPPAVIRRRIQREDATLSIDIVNGHLSPSMPITVSRQQHLQMAGWLRIPDLHLTSTTPMFVWLAPLEQHGDRPDFIASIYTREQRNDIAAAFGEEGLGAWYGFRLLGTLDRVPDGSYKLGMLVASRTDPRALLEFQSETVLIIG
ncbi:MAG: hypothetical protein EBZ59_08640, partial [Planctomycetia bacterium]|nr:hypothetical protein [Planctomycetia bacterium]